MAEHSSLSPCYFILFWLASLSLTCCVFENCNYYLKSPSIVRYNITGIEDFAKEMEEKKLGTPKVSLQFELSQSGITSLVKAEATVEEVYTVEEEVEVDEEENGEEASTSKNEAGSEEKEDTTEEARKLEEESEESTEENATTSDENATSEDVNATASEEATKTKPKKKKKTILQQKVS